MNHSYTAILVDDEALSLTVIEDYLKAFPEIRVIGRFTKSRQAAEKIAALKPDLVFLDIQMPVMNGFELLEAIAGAHDPYIIFTTAFEQYAIKAFDFNTIGYILKPFDRQRFEQCIQKFLRHRQSDKENTALKELAALLKKAAPEQEHLEHIMIKEASKIFYIPISDVIYFEAAGDYVRVMLSDRHYLINESLAMLEQKLSPQQFSRIHRSHIINIKQVKEFIPLFNGVYNLVMNNRQELKLSRTYKDNLGKIFKGL